MLENIIVFLVRVYTRIFYIGIFLWHKRPQAYGQSPPFRRARVALGMSLDTASLTLTLPLETIKNIEDGRYKATGLHPDFLIRVIKDYGKLLHISSIDIDQQVHTIKCASDALMPPPGRAFSIPGNHPIRTQLIMLATSITLSYVVFMGGWGLFCERECRCMTLSYLNQLHPIPLNHSSAQHREKCLLGGPCEHLAALPESGRTEELQTLKKTPPTKSLHTNSVFKEKPVKEHAPKHSSSRSDTPRTSSQQMSLDDLKAPWKKASH